MPEEVEECVESVLDDHPEYDEPRAYAICNAQKTGEVDDEMAFTEAVAQLAADGDTDRLEAIGRKVLGLDAPGQKAVAAGQQAPLQPTAVPDVDPESPPEEFTEALEAKDFIIYGKASIEKLDDGGQNSETREVLDMGALEDSLERFFKSEKAPGVISIGHDDVIVGRPLEEYTLEDSAAIEVGGDTFEFDEGETITTHVEDGDDDGLPELWLVADLANDTDVARKARLGVLMGELDGFSVTFGRKAVEPEAGGRRVTELDLFSVTLAPDDMVANKGAEFDLAGFKARMNRYAPTARADDATNVTEVAEEVARIIDQQLTDL